jgi:hypothetical protein
MSKKEQVNQFALKFLASPEALRKVNQRKITRLGAAQWAVAFGEAYTEMGVDDPTGLVELSAIVRAGKAMNASMTGIDHAERLIQGAVDRATEQLPSLLETLELLKGDVASTLSEKPVAKKATKKKATKRATTKKKEQATEKPAEPTEEEGSSEATEEADFTEPFMLEGNDLRDVRLEDLAIGDEVKEVLAATGLEKVGEILDVAKTQNLTECLSGFSEEMKQSVVEAIKSIASEQTVKDTQLLQG